MSYLDFIVLKENIGLEVVDGLINDVWVYAWNWKKVSVNANVNLTNIGNLSIY